MFRKRHLLFPQIILPINQLVTKGRTVVYFATESQCQKYFCTTSEIFSFSLLKVYSRKKQGDFDEFQNCCFILRRLRLCDLISSLKKLVVITFSFSADGYYCLKFSEGRPPVCLEMVPEGEVRSSPRPRRYKPVIDYSVEKAPNVQLLP